MEQTTFAKKTVVLAALGALSLMAATARADGTETPSDPQPKNIEVTVGSEGVLGIASEIKNDETSVTWGDEWLEGVLDENESFGGLTVKGNTNVNTITVTEKGSLTIDLPTQEAPDEEAAKVVTFDSVNLSVKDGGTFKNSSHVNFQNGSLTVEDGTFSNSSHVTFQNGSLTVANGAFTNKEGGVVELQDGTFTLSVTKADTVDDFTNAGTIVLKGNAQMTIDSGDDDPLAVETEDALALNVGNVEIGQGAMLTNKDKGYQVDNKDAEGEDDGEGVEPGEVQTLVHFGTVTVAEGGKFINAEGARSEGTALVIESVADGSNAAEINGTSVWGTLQLSQKVGNRKTLSNFVDIKDNADFRVTGELIIDSFAENGSFTLDGGSDTEVDANVFADGIDISVGSHVAADDLVQKSDGSELSWKDDVKPAVGTLTIKDFVAKYTPVDASEGEDETATGDEDTTGSWTYKKFGDVSVVNTKLEISGAQPSLAGSDPYGGHGYTPSLEMSSLNLVGTSMKIAYDVDVERVKDAVKAVWNDIRDKDDEDIDMNGWTAENILEEIDKLLADEQYAELKEKLAEERATFENKLDGVLDNAELDAESTITESDLAIGTLTISRNTVGESTTVKVEKPFISTLSGGGEDTATDGDAEETSSVSITGNETYDLGDLTLTVTKSNLDVGTLDLQTGAITLKDSKMMVDNVKTLNGSLTLESGYLGLNVTKNIADLEDKKDEAETKADPDTAPAGATLELGSPVTIGESGKLTIGGADTTSDGTKVDYAISIAGTTDIVFDGRNFGSEALFSQTRSDGGKGLVVANGTDTKLNVKATNLSWGVYKLFDEDTLNTDALKGKVSIDTTAEDTVNGLWQDAVGNKISADGNEIVVGGDTIEGSGLEDIGAVNLMNSVFGGDRGSALDKRFVDAVLSNASSLEEISNTINSVTGLGAVAGLTAMAVDFGNYVADQVEHHAVTMPRQAEGWWVQPIAGKLKSDDLAVGGMKSGYSIDTFGIMGGFDRKLRNGDTIGVAASYQSGDADSEGSALPVSTDVTNYGLHLWHARQFDAYRLMGMFSYSKTSGDAKMNYVGNEITSDLGATEISIGARADKEFKWGTVRMIPHAGVRASMIDVDDYTVEMGSDELFKVSEDKLWIFEVPVGVTFASSFEYARWNVQPYVDLTVRGRFGDTDSTFTVEGSSTSDSVKYDVTGDVIGDLRIGYMSTFQDLNLGMSYGLSAGDGGRQNHQIEATLRIDFN